MTLMIGWTDDSKNIQLRYSIEPRYRKHIDGYGFLSFAKSAAKNLAINMVKNNGYCNKNRNERCKDYI